MSTLFNFILILIWFPRLAKLMVISVDMMHSGQIMAGKHMGGNYNEEVTLQMSIGSMQSLQDDC